MAYDNTDALEGAQMRPLHVSEDVYPFVKVYNQHDPLTVIAAVPELRDKFFYSVVVGPHRIIGLTKQVNGIKDADALRQYVGELEVHALGQL